MTTPTPSHEGTFTAPTESWIWTIAVSDWPIGKADYDLTAAEALAALTAGKADQ